ncbi:MAG TPA: hypothetical protein VIF15_03840 [Polyangiaceae bacterium]|jgi:nicotinate phosphoribosyltransferase
MPSSVPLPPLLTSALGLGLEAFVTVRASIAAGIADARAAFELTVAAPSPDWGFLVLAGVEPLVDALERLRTRVDELDWLESVGAIDAPTRRRLAEARFACDVDAAPEGSVVFPGEAVLTVEGPFWQAQLIGGLVQAAISDATLVATRFARLSVASLGADLVENGSAIAHRLGGCPQLARAAFVGGAHATTSAVAGRRYGIPVSAMQPARFDLASGDAERALRAWLAATPQGSIVRLDPARARALLPRLAEAIQERARTSVAGWNEGRVAIELAGGDRIGLAREAAEVFARAGLAEPSIVVSGNVDERMVLELRSEGSPARAFAVRAEGTPGAAHIAGYELVAIEDQGDWSARLRVGDDVASSSDPGRKLLVRYVGENGRPLADVAHSTNERHQRAQGGRFVDRVTGLAARLAAVSSAPLRASAMRAGKRSAPPEPPSALRERALRSVRALDEGHRRITSPARYPVGMSPQVAALKADLLARTAT